MSWTVPSHGLRNWGVPDRDGAEFRLDAAGKQGVERRIGPQRPVRFVLVQAGRILLAVNVPVQPQSQPLRWYPEPSQLDAEKGDGELQQAAVDAPGLAKYFSS